MKTPRRPALACFLAFLAVMPGFCLTRARAADAELVSRLERIIVLRQAEAELQSTLPPAQSNADEAEVALCRARIDLARELGRQADVIAQLQQIVSIYQARFQRAQAMVANDLSGRQILRQVEIQLLEAEVALRREQRTAK